MNTDPISWEELGLPVPQPGSKEAMASDPGRIHIRYLHHYLCYPHALLVILTLFFSCLAGALLLHWGFWFGVALSAAAFWIDVNGSRWQALYGCVNPASVLSTRPYLVAVFTDLATGGEPYPAVKVLPQPLHRMTGGSPEVGTLRATVTLYGGTADDGERWRDVYPKVINCITTDETVIPRVFATIDPESWADLKASIQKLQQPYHPGLILVEPDGTLKQVNLDNSGK